MLHRLSCLSLLASLVAAGVQAQPLKPVRSFERLVTSNGWAVASYDRRSRTYDTFLENPYRSPAPLGDAPDLCFRPIVSRNLASRLSFGIRLAPNPREPGTWLTDVPLSSAHYLTGTGIIETDQQVRGLRVRTYGFMPMRLGAAVLILVARIDPAGAAGPVWIDARFNFHIGPSTDQKRALRDSDEVRWDGPRQAFFEQGPGPGTLAFVALSPLGEHRAGAEVPSMRSPALVLSAAGTAWFAVAVAWVPAGSPEASVARLRSWAGRLRPQELIEQERASWQRWHTPFPPGLSPQQHDLWQQSAAVLRMAQVRQRGPASGQVLASLPPGLGAVDAQWNITWVRDMAYAVVALSRTRHLAEAAEALRFQLQSGPGRHVAQVGRPYRLSVTRYFGDGQEESDCNQDGPNIEFDGFGLFLWSLGEYLRAGGDLALLRRSWPVIRDEVAEVLVSLLEDSGQVRADSSIWEVHWQGQQRHFTYTSLAAARGLCEAAQVAQRLGQRDDAGRYLQAGRRVRDAVLRLHTDAHGALTQSAEDLLSGRSPYVDAAVVEALNWGLVDPRGRVGHATLEAILGHLWTPSGKGLMRNNNGGAYDSQEWVFIDLRMVPALRAAGRGDQAETLLSWVEGQAQANDLLLAELHDARSGAYAGSIPMAGFGAGAYLLALSADSRPADPCLQMKSP